MSRSRLLMVVAMTLTVAFVLLPACLEVPASTAPTDLPSDCHGQHGSTPAPAHTCCYAGHHAPATVQAAPSPVLPMISVNVVYVPDDDAAAHRHVLPVSTDASLSPPTILRI